MLYNQNFLAIQSPMYQKVEVDYNAIVPVAIQLSAIKPDTSDYIAFELYSQINLALQTDIFGYMACRYITIYIQLQLRAIIKPVNSCWSLTLMIWFLDDQDLVRQVLEESDNGSDCMIVYHQRNLTQPAPPVCARMHLNAQNCCALQFLAKICIDDALCLHISKLPREGGWNQKTRKGGGVKSYLRSTAEDDVL